MTHLEVWEAEKASAGEDPRNEEVLIFGEWWLVDAKGRLVRQIHDDAQSGAA